MSILLIISSALVTGLCFTFYKVGFIAYFSLIPLFYVMLKDADNNKNPVRSYFKGYLWGVVFFASVFYWFAYQYPLEYLGFSTGEAIGYVALTWFGIGVLLSFLLALWQLSFAFFAKSRLYKARKWLFIPFVSAFYVLIEFVYTLGPLASPWSRLAVTQQAYTVGIQTASVFGSYFLSFLIVFVNACLAYAFYVFRREKTKKTPLCFAAAALCSVIVNYAAGAALYFADRSYTDGLDTYNAAALQGNIVSGRNNAGGPWEVLDRFTEMINEDLKENETKLFVLPEGCFSLYLESNGAFEKELRKLSADTGAVLLFSCYQYDEENRLYNVMWCASPDGGLTGPYRKQHPVPFGEFTPAKDIILAVMPFLKDVTNLGDELSAGGETVVMDSSVGKISGFICFDSTFEQIGIEAVHGGAEILFESSNDSWWMDSPQLYEHNGHAVLRAVETRRCIVRSTSAGYSTVINSRGETLSSVAALTEGAAHADVYNRIDLCFYMSCPYLFLILCAACTACLTAISVVYEIKSRKNQKTS
ncbi:MAG: apolipoprotein N-acyltransferase [Clostridia bacterium]|nr:apolipoprotein N-acyltransferase [Clostridia bacterium]